MTTKDTLIRGYAEAMVSIADAEGSLDKVEAELFEFAAALEQHTELAEALTDTSLPTERKQSVVEELVGPRSASTTANVVLFVVEQGRARDLGRIIGEIADVVAERRQQSLAEVRTAVPLTDAQIDEIRAALTTALGRAIEVRVILDPSVIGGVVTRIGDEVIDGSVRGRLAGARQQLGS